MILLSNLGFNARSYAVNKIITKNSIHDMDCDVAAGKKANTTIEMKKSFLEENNIDVIRNIDVLFWAYDNDKSFKEFDTNQITVYTSASDEMKNYQIEGENVYNKDGLIIDYLSNEKIIIFSLINETDKYLNFTIENMTINDFTSSDIDYDLYEEIVLDGCQYVFIVKVSDEFMETNRIEDIEKIEFTMEIHPEEDWFDSYSTEMILFEVKWKFLSRKMQGRFSPFHLPKLFCKTKPMTFHEKLSVSLLSLMTYN